MNSCSQIIRTSFVALVLSASVLTGCKETPPPSLYSPSEGSAPTPVVTSITPTFAVAPVTVLTLTGSNFSSDPSKMLVYFNTSLGIIQSASPTELKVLPPLLSSDSVAVRVSVQGAMDYSAPVYVGLDAAVAEFGNVAAGEDGFAIACDATGNIYVSLTTTSTSAGLGTKMITSAGVRSDYAANPAGVTKWSGFKVGPGGIIYAVYGRGIIFQIPVPTGGTPSTPTLWLSGSGLGNIVDLDFDENANIWAVGNSGSIFRITPAKSVKKFAFTGTMRTVRVFSGSLYVGGRKDTVEGIWRLPMISSDSLGTPELYYSLNGNEGGGVYAITFSSDGDLYVGTDGPEGLFIVHPGKTSEPVYPGLLQPQTLTMAWGKSTDLYLCRQGLTSTHRIIRINTLKTSAPYYGRGL
ncbi:MAG: IPT/TIG domain-containing protein [Bacteroidota bacterium]